MELEEHVIDVNNYRMFQDDLMAVRKVLYKYQARYHGASVMDQRDWDEGQRCLLLLDKWIRK